jgi:hypothetical protein
MNSGRSGTRASRAGATSQVAGQCRLGKIAEKSRITSRSIPDVIASPRSQLPANISGILYFSGEKVEIADCVAEQKGFEPSTLTSPFHREIVRGFGDKFPED